MGIILTLLLAVVAIGSFVCWIMVLIRMFNSAGALQGVIGIICSIWAFIWGWMNAGKEGLKNVMMAWTVLLVLLIVIEIAAFALR
jgi:hypothetical protein